MFTQKLKQLRLERGLSQQQIADKLGISNQAYSRWETGKFSPNLQSLEKIAKTLNVPIEELLSNKPLSLEKILSSETITFQDKELSEKQLNDLKQFIKELIK